jgi:hypothetical protein
VSHVVDRAPEVQERIRRTGLFLACVVATLFWVSTAFVLWRWYTR